jgi:hypothetical protein
LVRPKYILEINEKGFIDYSSAISAGFVPWNDVKDIYISSVYNQKFISVTFYDLENFLQMLPSAKRKLVLANIKLSYDPIQINLNSAHAKYEDVLLIMQQKHSAWQTENSECM